MKYLRRTIIILVFILFILTTKAHAQNKVIVLDPGHGGSDQGASNLSAGIIERDVNLKIAKYLKQYLDEYAGVEVILTHNGFHSGKMELLDRAMVGRNNNADMLISLHCNASATSSTVTGAEAFVTASKVLPKYNEKCSKLANLVLNKLNKLGIKNKGVKTRLSGSEDELYSDGTRGDYYGIIRYSMKGIYEGPGANIQNGEGMSAVLIEHCYIQNGDEKYIDSDEDIKKIARADCDAIVEFYNLHLKEKSVSSITLNIGKTSILKGDTLSLKATIYPETAEDKTIMWSSSNEKVAKVVDGKVTAVEGGEATITATTKDGGYTSKCEITVQDLEIQVNSKEIYCLQNDKYKFTYKIKPYLPEGRIAKLEISDNKIASIDNNNIITANHMGKTNIIIKIIEKNQTEEKIILQKQIPIKVNKLNENEYININNYKEQNSILTKITPKTLTEDFLKNIKVSKELEVTMSKSDTEYVATNTKVTIKRKKQNEIIKEYYCHIFGDINEDGKITATDYGYIKNYIMTNGKTDIKNIEAADVSRDGKVTATDYGYIKNYIMKGTELKIE